MSIAFVLKTHTTDLMMNKVTAMSIATCNKKTLHSLILQDNEEKLQVVRELQLPRENQGTK
jgi:hypothetical protein